MLKWCEGKIKNLNLGEKTSCLRKQAGFLLANSQRLRTLLPGFYLF